MKIENRFEMPDEIYAGLIKGAYVRRGAVIEKKAEAGGECRVVLWLREASPFPLPSRELVSAGVNTAAVLGLVAASAASFLNLGATVCFAPAMIKLFAGLDFQFQRMGTKLDSLQWTVEMGFASALKCLETLVRYQELEMLGDLKTAATLAWDAQALQPGGTQRIMRVEQALALVTRAAEKLQLITESEMSAAIERFENAPHAWQRLNPDDAAINAMARLRYCAVAAALRASINAEAGDIISCVKNLRRTSELLSGLLKKIGFAFLKGSGAAKKTLVEKMHLDIIKTSAVKLLDADHANVVYDHLLNRQWKGVISPDRIGMWAMRFDGELRNLNDVMELLRELRGIKIFSEKYKVRRFAVEKLSTFADLLDAAFEDLDRLSGYVSEYQAALDSGLSIFDYRKMLEVKKMPERDKLLFLG